MPKISGSPSPAVVPSSSSQTRAQTAETPAQPAATSWGSAPRTDAAERREKATGVSTRKAELTETERTAVVEKKATCPFIATGVKTGALPVRNDADKPLASIDDVAKLGNTGKGSDLGELLRLFAQGNHGFMPGMSGKLDMPAPPGHFSLDFPGSQGSHPGHSGILQGDPTRANSGRFSDADWDRLKSFAKLLGEDNLIGSAGEFGLLTTFLANSPNTTQVGGLNKEPAYSVAELEMMFKQKQFPPGWETWKKTSADWAINTSALALAAEKEVLKSNFR